MDKEGLGCSVAVEELAMSLKEAVNLALLEGPRIGVCNNVSICIGPFDITSFFFFFFSA